MATQYDLIVRGGGSLAGGVGACQTPVEVFIQQDADQCACSRDLGKRALDGCRGVW